MVNGSDPRRGRGQHLSAEKGVRGAPKRFPQQADHGVKGLRNLLEKITPWLFAVGSWIFGGLIAFNLVAVSSLLTVP